MQWHMPVGYKVVNGKITIYEEHQKIVEEIFHDYDNGISTTRIAKSLKAKGICNAHDRVAWTHVSIGKILENHNYLGTEYYPQLIDRELFDRVQKRREQIRIDKGRGSHRPGRDERILFGGVITCGECGEVCSHIQPRSREKKRGGAAKWKCKNYIYQNHVSCTGGLITDEQVKAVCVSAINQMIQDKTRMPPPVTAKETVSMEYRKIERRLELAKSGQKQNAATGKTRQESDDIEHNHIRVNTRQENNPADIMTLIYERAQERYRTLKINDTDYRTRKMQEVLSDRNELTEFDEELYRKLVTRIVVYKNNTAKVVFLNGSSIKVEYQPDNHKITEKEQK
ncbi:hypothetical protein C804_05762 [Lachnospiraceae bacterium A4]|nr:hypothetical protein C804_05762 [Lachnospiraceae bacterium A4]